MASNPLFIQGGDASDRPLDAIVPVDPANAPLPNGPCRALWVGVGGTANIRDGSGTIRVGVPLFAGLNPIVCQEVRPGGTADDIWAGY